MTKVASWVQKLTEDILGGPSFKIGDVVTHPDGRQVKIMGGEYWGEFGISNFWYWREVNPDGNLSRKLEHGYGW